MSASEARLHSLSGTASLEQARVLAAETSRVLGEWGLPEERLPSWEMARRVR